ncbi:MAG: hypothetical protein V3U44_04885, partial [Alphaproteobacteria bacterium]
MTGADLGEIGGNQERPAQGPAQGLDPGRFACCQALHAGLDAIEGLTRANQDRALSPDVSFPARPRAVKVGSFAPA